MKIRELILFLLYFFIIIWNAVKFILQNLRKVNFEDQNLIRKMNEEKVYDRSLF